MPPVRICLMLFGAMAAKIAHASTVYAFPNPGCDDTGYFDTITATQGTCAEVFLSDSDFQTVGNNSGEYQAFFSLQTEEAEGCGVVIAQNSGDANAPQCGECVILLHTANQCTPADLPTTYYTQECCGQVCQDLCGQIPGKRSIGKAAEALGARKAPASRTSPDIANLKNRSPISSAPKVKRSDCAFTQSGSLYTQAGSPSKVSDTINACGTSGGCSEMYSGTVESSFSQGFDVSESTEAGFFDIVSETVSFGYSATWESSKSVTVSGSTNFEQGESGYITFSPLSTCTLGTFAGSDCGDIPTGGDPRSACVPQTNNGVPLGDINVVTVA